VEREFAWEPDAERYTLRLDGQLASVIDTHTLGDAISFSRVFTSPPFRGNGYAAEIVAWATDHVEQTTDLRIVPTCWYAASWFDQHPGRSGLLARRAG